jgi:ribonuclease I
MQKGTVENLRHGLLHGALWPGKEESAITIAKRTETQNVIPRPPETVPRAEQKTQDHNL